MVLGETCMLVNIGLTRSECASWVQAWGSIGAIAAGLLGVLWQLRKQRQQLIAGRVADVQLMAGLVFKARMSARMCRDNIRVEGVGDSRADLLYWISQLEKLPPLAFPTHSTQLWTGYVILGRQAIEQHMGAARTPSPTFVAETLQSLIESAELAELGFSRWLQKHGAEIPSMGLAYNGRTFNPIRADVSEGEGLLEDAAGHAH